MSQSIALNTQPHQKMSVSKTLKHEIISFQSAQVPTFSAPFSIFLRLSSGYIIHDAVLVMTQSAPISGLTGSVANFPQISPIPFAITSYDVNVNGVTVDTRRGDEQWLLNNLLPQDETRLLTNLEMGSYTSNAARNSLNVANGKYYYPLQIPLLNGANYKILNPSHEMELKFNMNSATNVINQSTLTGTPVLTFGNAEILLRVTRLPPAVVQNELSQLIKQPRHYLYNRLQYAPYNLNAGISNASITLSTLNGNISHLMFIVRPNTALTNLNQWSYTQISQFEIKDSAGSSLTGGRSILDRESRLNHSKYWTKSSYLADYENGAISNSFVYLYSFSADPVLALTSGAKLNSFKFTGQELLNVTFPTALAGASTLEVFAFQEAALEQSIGGVKVLAV